VRKKKSISFSSLQEEEAQEPQLDILQQVAVRIIQRAWRRHVVGAGAAVGAQTPYMQIKVP